MKRELQVGNRRGTGYKDGVTGHSSVGMNDRYTHHVLKPLQQVMDVLSSFNEEPGANHANQ